MRGAAPNQEYLTMRNIVQHALGITRADAAIKCQKYSEQEQAAILAAEDDADRLAAIGAAEDRIAGDSILLIREAHKKACQQKAKPDAEKMQGETKEESGTEEDAEEETTCVDGELEVFRDEELEAKYAAGASETDAAPEGDEEPSTDAKEELEEKPAAEEKPASEPKAKRKKKSKPAEEK